jgi:hypothetical protein
MSETDKRCGTCKWWNCIGTNTDRQVRRWNATGGCNCSIPDSIVGEWERILTRDTEGKTCTAWQPKEPA